jgi:hypothetical protein
MSFIFEAKRKEDSNLRNKALFEESVGPVNKRSAQQSQSESEERRILKKRKETK